MSYLKARIFTWDWKAQPDMTAIATAVTELSKTGQVFMRPLETGTDLYAWVVSDHQVTDKEAWELYRS